MAAVLLGAFCFCNSCSYTLTTAIVYEAHQSSPPDTTRSLCVVIHLHLLMGSFSVTDLKLTEND
jgi:hypothetical protein